MSSPDVFRSPPAVRTRREADFHISSSPDLPPLRDIIFKKPKPSTLRSGSRAAPIPDHAPTSFTSAAQVWKLTQKDASPKATAVQASAVEEIADEEPSVCILEVPPKPVTQKRKPARRKKPIEDAESPSKAQGAGKGAESPAQTQPWKKYISSPQGTPERKSPEKSPVVESPRAGPHPESRQELKMGSPQPQQPMAEHPVPRASKIENTEPLQIEQATARRLDWTPPAPKQYVVLDSDSPEFDANAEADEDAKGKVFATLLEKYGCQEELVQESNLASDADSAFLKKRKLLELVAVKNVDGSSRSRTEQSPTKQKAPKKKPRTLTELATAAYKAPEPEDPDSEPSLLTYFATELAEREATASNAEENVGGKGKGKAKARRKKPATSRKKAVPPKPKLLSPSAALRQFANQDYVFGTSSQLANEHSPSFLRDLHNAMRQSNHFAEEMQLPLNSDEIEPPEQRSRLWGAGARDEEGDLFDVQVVDLASRDLPPDASQNKMDPFGYVKPDDEKPTEAGAPANLNTARDGSFMDIDDILPLTRRQKAETVPEDSPHSKSQASASANLPPPEESIPTKDAEPRGPQPTQNSSSATHNAPAVALNAVSEPRPQYEIYTDAQLSREIASYGFKAVKRRNGMIALLEQCWQSKVQLQTGPGTTRAASTLARASPRRTYPASTKTVTETQEPGTKPKRGRPRKQSVTETTGEPQEPPPSAQPQTPPKRPRGRPRKDTTSPSKAGLAKSTKTGASKAAPTAKTGAAESPQRRGRPPKTLVEIPDSGLDMEGSIASSSACSSPDKTFSSPLAVDLSLSMAEDSELPLTLSPTDQQAALFERITKAITTAPRTTDPANPSWHEKILLYDPIVLEDLAAWLNSGQLTRVGHDGEVNPVELKKWCESKSICCLWRVNLRGKERKRY